MVGCWLFPNCGLSSGEFLRDKALWKQHMLGCWLFPNCGLSSGEFLRDKALWKQHMVDCWLFPNCGLSLAFLRDGLVEAAARPSITEEIGGEHKPPSRLGAK